MQKITNTDKLIGGVSVSSNIFLGAGVVKDPLVKELPDYIGLRDLVGMVTIGSVTPQARNGNTGKLNWPKTYGHYSKYSLEGGLHANGMRNLGIKETLENLPKESNIPIAVSLAGYSVLDYVGGLQEILKHKNASLLSAVEINCSCPTMGSAPMAYSLETLSELFKEIRKTKSDKPLWFKLSPYFTEEAISDLHVKYPKYNFNKSPIINVSFIADLCGLLKQNQDVVSAIIVSNGLPGVFRGHNISVNKDSGIIDNGGGLSGKLLKENNLATIRLLRSHGVVSDIIGCGGVLGRKDIDDYISAGAQAVQAAGGPVWGGGPLFFKNFN